MEKIIEIDEIYRIRLLPGNLMLQHKKKSKNGRIGWVLDGFFPDWASMCEHYIFVATIRSIEGTEQIKKLIEVVQRSTDQISLILNNIEDKH